MTTVGVTGASGHLGGYLVPYLWERGYVVTQIGRTIPADLDCDVVLHLAAPREWRDAAQAVSVARFTEELAGWAMYSGSRVINTGSWWQYAEGPDVRSLPYVRLKCDQLSMFDTTLVPFSIYGARARGGRGFVPHLVNAVRSGVRIPASGEPRDFVHVRDVCAAYEAALHGPAGVFEVRTGRMHTPASLVAAAAGYSPEPLAEFPSCAPVYKFPTVPGWRAKVDVRDHISQALGVAA